MLEAKDTGTIALQKQRSSEKFFRRSPETTVFQKIFHALHKLLTTQKIVLSPNWEQSNFGGLEALRLRSRTWSSRPRTSKCVLEDTNSGICWYQKKKKKTGTMAWAVQKIDFLGGPFEGVSGSGGTLQLCQNICLLNIYWYKKKKRPSLSC